MAEPPDKQASDDRSIRFDTKQDVGHMEGGQVVGTLIEQLHVHQQAPPDPERRDLLILLHKVRAFWVEAVLDHSVHTEALLDLGKATDPEAVEHPWEQILEVPDATSERLPPGTSIAEVFARHGRALLILGVPGSGKTITLLELARALLDQAEEDPLQAIPVVFNLSSWTDPKQSLFDWLAGELSTKYRIGEETGRRWLQERWLLPLLDGLDEVRAAHRAACVKAINAFVEAHGVPGLAVCSRQEEYEALTARLKLNGAIRLQPLEPAQVEAHVARSGAALAGLGTALQRDRVLQEMAETPLMLDVMTLAYRDIPAEALAGEELDKGARRSHLFETYIDKMFRRKGKAAQPYEREQILGWLTWLARGMQKHNQTVFLIEQLQPSWLQRRWQRRIYTLGSRLLIGLMFGLMGGLIGGFIFGLVAVLWYGGVDVIQHYTLRFLLTRNGYLPMKLVPFLDYATRLVFLRNVGGGYIFIHRLLLEHFASRGDARAVSSMPTQTAQA